MHKTPVNVRPQKRSYHIGYVISSFTLHCNKLFLHFKRIVINKNKIKQIKKYNYVKFLSTYKENLCEQGKIYIFSFNYDYNESNIYICSLKI